MRLGRGLSAAESETTHGEVRRCGWASSHGLGRRHVDADVVRDESLSGADVGERVRARQARHAHSATAACRACGLTKRVADLMTTSASRSVLLVVAWLSCAAALQVPTSVATRARLGAGFSHRPVPLTTTLSFPVNVDGCVNEKTAVLRVDLCSSPYASRALSQHVGHAAHRARGRSDGRRDYVPRAARVIATTHTARNPHPAHLPTNHASRPLADTTTTRRS